MVSGHDYRWRQSIIPKRCGCSLKAQGSQRVEMYATMTVVRRLIVIVRARLQGNANENPKERLAEKAMAKVVY